jgi:hypothetical protein
MQTALDYLLEMLLADAKRVMFREIEGKRRRQILNPIGWNQN